ncbi:MAG: hypothetical protein AMS22_06205 [Thiotrichales bacterium SG8_50]|nr:MAG: hypothetical protein AMS22_06205 [Thiotrichales bacterium SG8_50]
MALNDGQALLDVTRLNRIIEFDEVQRQVRVEAGVRLIDIFREFHHRNLTLPSSPTESHSSVSGAICANVNGKDGWHVGSFGNQVVSMTMLLASGELVEIDKSHELFNVVIGGMGLTGVIVEATLQLKPINSPYLDVTCIPATNVDALLETLASVERSNDLAVVWIDAYARGDRVGRSVIHAARWAERDDTEEERRAYVQAGYERLSRHRRFGLAVHEFFGPMLSLMLNAQRLMLPVFNRLYFAMNSMKKSLGRSSYSELFLKFSFEASFTVPPAHLVCGPYGYTLQLTFPKGEAREAIVELLEICQTSPCPPVTTVLRAHKRDEGLISFSEDGYSLNFEFHPKKRHRDASRKVIDQLLEATINRGGKLHLTKDHVATPEQFRRLYPRYRQLLRYKRKLDPGVLFTSDLARRVGII